VSLRLGGERANRNLQPNAGKGGKRGENLKQISSAFLVGFRDWKNCQSKKGPAFAEPFGS